MSCVDSASSWVGMAQAEVAEELCGVAVRKLFPKYGYFNGNVVGFDHENGLFTIRFEDGDEESMDLKTLALYLPTKECMKAKEFLGLSTGRGSKGAVHRKSEEDVPGDKQKRVAEQNSSDSEVEIVPLEKKAPEVINISDSDSMHTSDEDGDYDSDESEWEETGSSTNGKAKIKVGKVTVEAFCVDVDDDGPGTGGKDLGMEKGAQESEAGAANEEVRSKIRKMLKLGLHPDTPDAEAQQALKNANRFLTRYNLQQVDVLREGEENDSQGTLAGGMKVVKLRSTNAARKTVNNAAWISSLGSLVSNCFDCCYYTQHRRDGIHYVFYGVVTNAECAGYAFAAAFNRITVMTANYCGDGPKAGHTYGRHSFGWGASAASETSTMRANYRDGLVEGLRKAVVEEKQERKKRAQEREERRKAAMAAKQEAKLAKARAEAASLAELDDDAPLLGAAAGKAEAESSNQGVAAGGGEASDSDGYFDSAASGEEDNDMGSKWRAKAEKQQSNQSQALVVLEQECKKVADKVLEDKKIKLRKGPALGGTSRFDAEAYRKGQEDAKQIDIKQRGIANKPASKKRRSS